jgi:transposase
MPRKFKTVDYEASLDQQVSLRECLPPEHLARFIAKVISELDLSDIYAAYGRRGGSAIAPEVLLGLLFYGYAIGVFSSRKIERATYESIPFRFLSGHLHPDHDTIASFRQRFLDQIKGLFVQVLLLAVAAEVLTLDDGSLDGTKIHADASKRKAISYGHLGKLRAALEAEVEELLRLGEAADAPSLPEAVDVRAEIDRRRQKLAHLTQAEAVLQARAEERYQLEQAEYEAKLAERAARQQETGRKPRGQAPKPPRLAIRDKDQYNFTDPESRIMKNAGNRGFDQHYKAQVTVSHQSLLVIATHVSNHPNDQLDALPTVDGIDPRLGKPKRAALDNGYFSLTTIEGLQSRGIEPYIATGRQSHSLSWKVWLEELGDPPAPEASPKLKMAYKLKTDAGQAIYRLRKCTVEPVIGIIKEAIGFRQFSLRGLDKVQGEWSLVCLAFNLKRLHRLTEATQLSPTGC